MQKKKLNQFLIHEILFDVELTLDLSILSKR